MASIYISLISKELKVLHRFFFSQPFFFLFNSFDIALRSLSISLVLSHTATQATKAIHFPSIVLGPGEGAAVRESSPGSSAPAVGCGQALRVSGPRSVHIEALALAVPQLSHLEMVGQKGPAHSRHLAVGGCRESRSDGVLKPQLVTSGPHRHQEVPAKISPQSCSYALSPSSLSS